MWVSLSSTINKSLFIMIMFHTPFPDSMFSLRKKSVVEVAAHSMLWLEVVREGVTAYAVFQSIFPESRHIRKQYREDPTDAKY
jgi:hypothetical protein